MLLERLTLGLRGLVSGLKYGYPMCCVLNYVLDSFLGIPSGLSRGDNFDPKLGSYVPCHFHRRVHKSLSRAECLELMNSGFAVEHLAPEDAIETLLNGRVVSRIRVPQGADAVFLAQVRLIDGT